MPLKKQRSDKPFFSVVIPTLNEEKYLPLLLEDLAKQTLADFEVLIIDGKSVDDTVKKALAFPFVEIIVSEKRNVSFQRNLGGKHANGEFIIFFDADTRIPDYFLEGIYYHLTTNPADIFTTWMSTNGLKNSEKSLIGLFNFIVESSYLIDYPSVFGAMIGCRRSTLNELGGFDETITFAEDSEFLARLKNQGAIFRVYRDPRFTYSLRRFQKEGTIKLFRKTLRLHLGIVFSGFPHDKTELYPMEGGEYYGVPEELSSSVSGRLLQSLSGRLKKLRERSDFAKLLEKFFEE